jgi:hypothetical protein
MAGSKAYLYLKNNQKMMNKKCPRRYQGLNIAIAEKNQLDTGSI